MRTCNLPGFKNVLENLYHSLTLKTILAALACSFDWVFGTNKQTVLVIVVLIAIDTFTGVIKAIKIDHLRSRYFLGFTHKLFVYFTLIVTAALVDKVVPVQFAQTIVYTFLACTEALSIVENLAIMGVPLPDRLVKKLKYVTDVRDMLQKKEDSKK